MLKRSYILNNSKEVKDCPFKHLSQEILAMISIIKPQYSKSNGNVNYCVIKNSAEYHKYKTLTERLRCYDLRFLKEENYALAFWINLYNALIIDGIITLEIKKTVKKAPRFFSIIKYDIGGTKYTPNDIEYGTLGQTQNI